MQETFTTPHIPQFLYGFQEYSCYFHLCDSYKTVRALCNLKWQLHPLPAMARLMV